MDCHSGGRYPAGRPEDEYHGSTDCPSDFQHWSGLTGLHPDPFGERIHIQTTIPVDLPSQTLFFIRKFQDATGRSLALVSMTHDNGSMNCRIMSFLNRKLLRRLLLFSAFLSAAGLLRLSRAVGLADAAGNNVTASAVAVMVSNPTSSPLQDFQTRCAQPGVVVCEGFDNASTFAQTGGRQGIHPSTGNGSVMTQDATTARSGTSAHCVVPAQTGPDACGSFKKGFGQIFGQNTTFYVQYAQKIDANVLNQHPTDSSGSQTFFKQQIIASFEGGTCASKELTTVNIYDRGFPFMYSQCGRDNFQIAIPTNDFLLEQGDQTIALGDPVNSGYNCHYQTQHNGPNSCATYPAGVWVTYYYKVQIGTWGSPNSNIYAWRALPNEGYKEWIKIQNHTLQNTEAGSGYDMIDLLHYYTGRNGRRAFGQTGATWYDELIVSMQPIAAPAVPPELP